MRFVALLLALALPALADPAARKKKKQPWEELLESSRAAFDASKKKAPAAPAPAPAAALTLPPLPLPLPEPVKPQLEPAVAKPAPAPLIAEPEVDQPARNVVVPAVVEAPPPAMVAEPARPAVVAPASNLDFDLLGSSPAPAPASDPLLEQRIGLRRTMLTVHQTVGLGLVGLMAGTMATGQLNYLDKFGGPNSARYEQTHKWLATATLTTFAGAGLLAFFAPVPMERTSEGIDRATIHKAGMIGATGGMAAEAVLGILTANREGYANQSGLAATHLAIGYFTLLCMSVGVGALVF